MTDSSGQAAPPPGMETKYNHDLDVAEPFLARNAQIGGLLRDARVVDEFNRYDALAKAHKKVFHRIGLGSLILGALPLLAAGVRLMGGDVFFAHTGKVGFLFDCFGVLAVLLVLLNRVGRYRTNWCRAMFFRERIRQWHFQMFLDGPLVELSQTDAAKFKAQLDGRWEALQEDLRGGHGTLRQFVSAGSRARDFFHERRDYKDQTLAGVVFSALKKLRIEHQLGYSYRKMDPDGEDSGLALDERATISESIATVSLGSAVLVAAVSFVVPLLGWERGEEIGRFLAGGALVLAVISAASRAYRAGFTLPDEGESYEEYCGRIRELEKVFDEVPSTPEKLRQLEALEEESVAELRRFLRMKMRATFLF